MTEVKYIFHDCFFISTQKFDLLFDFWTYPGFAAINKDLPYFISSRDNSKPLYVFVSHHHKDHFSKIIFSWAKLCPNIKYILSYDTAKFVRHMLNPNSLWKGDRVDTDSVVTMRLGDTYTDGLLEINAFGSTDIGCSYSVSFNSKTIFHAGDLNAWIWKDESTEAEVNAAIRDFRKIISDISSKFPVIDLAMFPVDSRIGTDWWTGAYLFVRAIDVKHFIPMHYELEGSDKEKACAFELYANPERGDYIKLSPDSAFAF